MKKYLENKQSLIWCKEKDCQGIAQLCEDLFLTSKYTIVCRSTMYLDLSEYRVHKITGGPLGDSNRYKRQPHIMQYDCWGNNEPVITRLIRECNIIGAVEQVIAACKNMNMGDTTVLSSFMCDISDNKNSLWITDETGKQRSFKELYQTPNTTEPVVNTNNDNEEEGWQTL